MRVVFLDIDGVLNSEAFLLKIDAQHAALGHSTESCPKSATTCTCYRIDRQIDPEAVARLNRIVAATGAKVVVSSSWRKLLDPPELLRVLTVHGLVAEIIGQTPDGHSPELLEAYGHPERMFRGYEIDHWLRQHPEVDSFVILDDGSDMAMHTGRLVQTDCEEGLLDDHVGIAIRMLVHHRRDEIGSYLVSTVQLPDEIAAALGMRYETLVYSIATAEWGVEGSGVRSATAAEADAAHEAVCARIKERIQ